MFCGQDQVYPYNCNSYHSNLAKNYSASYSPYTSAFNKYKVANTHTDYVKIFDNKQYNLDAINLNQEVIDYGRYANGLNSKLSRLKELSPSVQLYEKGVTLSDLRTSQSRFINTQAVGGGVGTITAGVAGAGCIAATGGTGSVGCATLAGSTAGAMSTLAVDRFLGKDTSLQEVGMSALFGGILGGGAGLLGKLGSGTSAVETGPNVGETVTHSIALPKPTIGTKLEYVFGNATGSTHNIARSMEMQSSLSKIGIFDDVAGRELLTEKLNSSYYQSTGVTQSNGRIAKDFILSGPGGNVKVVGIWEGEKLITVNIYGK